MKYLQILQDVLLPVVTACIMSVFFISAASCALQKSTSDKAHHTRTGFTNPDLIENPSFFKFLRWQWQRLWKNIPSADIYTFPLASNDPEFLRSNRLQKTLTWIGHATMLIQIDGVNILTDPHFSERSSPVQWAGPTRLVPPGIAFEDLPPIHIVFISHDHYDSLDRQSILKLYHRQNGKNTRFFVPLGMKKWFENLGVLTSIEMDWWDEYQMDALKIIATPMQHWGKRSAFSRNEHLWASWVVISKDFRFYFGGDTGYSRHFAETGKRYGPFDLALLPIGAYEPRWFMKNHHINPEEAVQAHKDLNSKKSVAMHWGTFILTDEPLDEPPRRLKEAMKNEGLSEKEFLVLQHGETIILE
ncbi:MAG: MBL fold metallo-hydrolase [Nitrospiraceae bacterium]|nr:MAG: MBL fold metallo-hydrolase [Nitrospiraceae bacterium]